MSTTLLIVAKAPVPGFAKTRVAESVGPVAAADLAAAALLDTLDIGMCCFEDVVVALAGLARTGWVVARGFSAVASGVAVAVRSGQLPPSPLAPPRRISRASIETQAQTSSRHRAVRDMAAILGRAPGGAGQEGTIAWMRHGCRKLQCCVATARSPLTRPP